MNENKYKYNFIKESIIYISNEFKKKGQEYGIITLNTNQIDILVESLDLMSVSPEVSFKFSERIEKFLVPRFNEVTQIIYSNKTLPSVCRAEFVRIVRDPDADPSLPSA